MSTLSLNRKARYNYEILETWEAGLALRGFEVKAIKTGHISLVGAYVVIKNEEAFLLNANVPAYQNANTPQEYDPVRSRKLLSKKSEIKTLIGKTQQKGLTLVALRVYTKRGRIKLEIGLARGKKKYDRREDIKKREAQREMQRAVRIKG